MIRRWFHFLFHSWHTVPHGSIAVYQQCSVCGQRRVLPQEYGYSPVDWQWLETGKWMDKPKPPSGGSGIKRSVKS